MKQEEAIKLIKSKYPNCAIGLVTETDNYFVINILTENDKANVQDSDNGVIQFPTCDNSLKAVNKETKSIFTYNPIKHG